MLNTKQVTVGTAPVLVLAASPSPLKVLLHNAEKSSNTFIWFGGSATVTTSTGAHLDNATTYQLTLSPGSPLYAVSDSNDRNLHVIWQEH
jgi:hypothetical protein